MSLNMKVDEYRLTQLLGIGSFGEVYLTQKDNSDCKYATKKITNEKFYKEEFNKYYINEISILKSLVHDNIIKLYDVKKTPHNHYIIMEYCNGGSLTECLKKYKNLYKKPFTEEIVQHIMLQIIDAVNFIHSHRIIHRDLKLDNILVKFKNETDKNKLNLLNAEIKIIDFGTAAYKGKNGLLSTLVGTPLNMDPLILKKNNPDPGNLIEINRELGYDEKADIWSIGALCYEMMIGCSPFSADEIEVLKEKIKDGTYKVPISLSKESVSFLNSMLQYEPPKRFSANELKSHPFLVKNINDFTHIDKNKLSQKIYGDELIMNIKEDEKYFDIIPKNIFNDNIPLSQSTFQDINSNFNGFNIEVSTYSENLYNGMKSSSKPIPEEYEVVENQNIQNVMNNPFEINENDKQIVNTPIKQPIIPQKNIIVNNNVDPLSPQIQKEVKNNLQINAIEYLDNRRQIIKTESNLDNYQQTLQQIEEQNEFNKINHQQINKLNLLEQTPIKQNVPNNFYLKQMQQNQLNTIQNSPINSPWNNYKRGPVNQVGLPQMVQNQQNVLRGNRNQPNHNQIQSRPFQFNQIQPNHNPNIINNQIKNVNFINDGNFNNRFINNPIENNLAKNQFPNDQAANNLIPNHVNKGQISNNIIYNNQIPINVNINNQFNNPQKKIPNGLIQNKPIQNIIIPRNVTPIKQNQNNIIPSRSPNKLINNIQLYQQNQKIIANIYQPIDNIYKQINTPIKQGYNVLTHRRIVTGQMDTQRPTVNQQQMRHPQLQNGHIITNQIAPNQVMLAPNRQFIRQQVVVPQPIQANKIPVNTQRMIDERNSKTPLGNMSQKRYQINTFNNRNLYNNAPKPQQKLVRNISQNQLLD